MKRSVIRILPFFAMFLLSVGSVVISCQSAPSSIGKKRSTMNTGLNANGRIATVQVFSSIETVLVVDGEDHSRKIELKPADWSYNPVTTELTLKRPVPFARFIVHVEGQGAFPQALVLSDRKPASDLLVVLDGRLAIEGYDYELGDSGERLQFRDDVDLEAVEWYLQYVTPMGLSSVGDWKAGNGDQVAYLEAAHRKKTLDAWYDSQTTFWFMEAPAVPGGEPALVQRAATAQELASMKAYPVAVIKARPRDSFYKIGKELGFNPAVPTSVSLSSGLDPLRLTGKLIEEYSVRGKLGRTFHALYDTPDGEPIECVISASSPDRLDVPDFPIGTETRNLGLPVTVTRAWSLLTSNPDAKPTLAVSTSFSWTEKGLHFSVDVPGSQESLAVELVQAVIEKRR